MNESKWENILKAPLYQGEEFEQPKIQEGFEWLNRFSHNDLNVKFISEDGSVRAAIKLGLGDGIHWKLYLFVTKEALRGQGYGEKGLVEMITELRRRESQLLKSILKSYQKFAGGSQPDKLEISIMNASPPLDIKLSGVDPDAKYFWTRMINKYDNLGLRD